MEKPRIEKLDMEAYQKKTCTWKLGGDKNTDPHIHTKV
jgi:hypothetical protein